MENDTLVSVLKSVLTQSRDLEGEDKTKEILN
jgi:hypothetical protein